MQPRQSAVAPLTAHFFLPSFAPAREECVVGVLAEGGNVVLRAAVGADQLDDLPRLHAGDGLGELQDRQGAGQTRAIQGHIGGELRHWASPTAERVNRPLNSVDLTFPRTVARRQWSGCINFVRRVNQGAGAASW